MAFVIVNRGENDLLMESATTSKFSRERSSYRFHCKRRCYHAALVAHPSNNDPATRQTDRRIVLVRHGRSAHIHAGWIDVAGVRRWRQMYDAAGIDARERPPDTLQAIAAGAGMILASDAPRAMESARLLSAGAPVTVSPLLREFELAPPNLGSLRLLLAGWALAYGVRMLVRPRAHITDAERERAREAAGWLAGLTEEHGLVVAVTHATYRSVLAKAIERERWRCESPRRSSAHWSAWSFSPA
jgi:broad specificity phosphatase PhoE